MHGFRYILAFLAALTTMAAGPADSPSPKPSLIPKSWELGISFHDPQRITVQLPGDDAPKTFWYILYTATNESGQDVDFYPTFDLVTDTLQVVKAGEDIHPVVVDAIKARHAKQYPFFVNPMKVSGRLLQGEDNARTSAAVFRNFDAKANKFTIYVGGLSGEVKRMTNPGYDPQKPESEFNQPSFVLRKSLGVEYDLPGDEQSRQGARPVRLRRFWTMR